MNQAVRRKSVVLDKRHPYSQLIEQRSTDRSNTMDRIESLFIQAIAVSTVAMALFAGLSAVKPTDSAQPIVKLERVVVTTTAQI
ncbi:hypothetical protein BH10PSE17_BH10PSE17_09100 [soil metagenome]